MKYHRKYAPRRISLLTALFFIWVQVELSVANAQVDRLPIKGGAWLLEMVNETDGKRNPAINPSSSSPEEVDKLFLDGMVFAEGGRMYRCLKSEDFVFERMVASHRAEQCTLEILEATSKSAKQRSVCPKYGSTIISETMMVGPDNFVSQSSHSQGGRDYKYYSAYTFLGEDCNAVLRPIYSALRANVQQLVNEEAAKRATEEREREIARAEAAGDTGVAAVMNGLLSALQLYATEKNLRRTAPSLAGRVPSSALIRGPGATAFSTEAGRQLNITAPDPQITVAGGDRGTTAECSPAGNSLGSVRANVACRCRASTIAGASFKATPDGAACVTGKQFIFGCAINGGSKVQCTQL